MFILRLGAARACFGVLRKIQRQSCQKILFSSGLNLSYFVKWVWYSIRHVQQEQWEFQEYQQMLIEKKSGKAKLQLGTTQFEWDRWQESLCCIINSKSKRISQYTFAALAQPEHKHTYSFIYHGVKISFVANWKRYVYSVSLLFLAIILLFRVIGV